MYESLSAKGPKLVYSHTRQTLPERKLSEKTTPTPISNGPGNSTQLQSHAIPRPSVTVAAQTRKLLQEENTQPVSQEVGGSPSSGEVSILTSVSRDSTPSGMVLANRQNMRQASSYIHNSDHDKAEVHENYDDTHSDANSLLHDHATKANKNSTGNAVTINIERVSSLDNNNNAGSSSTDYDTISYSDAPDFSNNNGYHGGYRVYQGKVYEITREIPILFADNNQPVRPSPSQKMAKTLSSNGKPTHSSTATASIIKSGSATNGQISHTSLPLTDLNQQPRALPSPRLGSKNLNGISHSSAMASSDFEAQSQYDQVQPQLQHQQHQPLFREHRRPQDDSRFLDGPERLTYISGTQSLRRPNTAGGKKDIRDLSPQTWAVRGWTGPMSSSGSASRKAGSQHSANGTKTMPLRGNGGHIWTVVTKSPPHSPRQKRSSSTGQQIVTRASYRLDPNLSAKFRSSSPGPSQPTKSILKTSSSPVTSSGKAEQYDNHPLPSDRSRSTSPSYLLPRPRASLAYRDFDFSSLPPKQPTSTLAKHPKHSLQHANSVPQQHHRGKSPAPHSTTSRRPATASAALQKNDETLSRGSQPQKKSVTFNTQVRLHVDNNVSTIRSLSTDT